MLVLDFRGSWQKQLETRMRRKHEIQTSRDPGEYIAKIARPKGRRRTKGESETGSKRGRRADGAARVWPAPLGHLLDLESVSVSFSFCNFSFYLKTTNNFYIYDVGLNLAYATGWLR